MSKEEKRRFWDGGLTGWLTRYRRRNHQETFMDTQLEVNTFRELIEAQDCVGCKQSGGLELLNFKRNPHGWEADIRCKNCMCIGMVNSEGFLFERISVPKAGVRKR